MRAKFILIISMILTVAFGLFRAQCTEAALGDFFNFSNIPAHPLLKKIDEQNSIVNGVKVKTINYRADNNLDMPKIVDFYKGVLMQRGWKKSQEYLSGDYCIVGFTDDELRVFTVTMRRLPFIEDVITTITYIPGGIKSWIFKENPQDNDMPGSDFSWLPRYPGANRIQSVEDYTGVTTVSYLIIDYNCIDCVKEFYKEYMLKDDWQLITSNHQNKEEIQDTHVKSVTRTRDFLLKSGFGKKLKDKNIDLDNYEKFFDTQDMLPSEIYNFYFEKKDAVCSIGISYKEAQGGLSMVEQQMDNFAKYTEELTEEQRAAVDESLQENLNKMRPYYYQTQNIKEAIMVSVIYMPKRSSIYSPKKSISFNLGLGGRK